jgi:hypothetical protein
LPLLCPVDKNVCEAEIKFWPCQDPEIPAAVKDLIKGAFVPRDPEIPAAVKVLIKVAFVPRDPEMLEAI